MNATLPIASTLPAFLLAVFVVSLAGSGSITGPSTLPPSAEPPNSSPAGSSQVPSSLFGTYTHELDAQMVAAPMSR